MSDGSGESADPLVTAVVTTYDRPEFLRRAVETVAAQTYDPIELVVVDDHSEIPAERVLDGHDPDVAAFEIRRHEENRGANAARNTGIKAATGEYIAFLDDDDRWDPEKLARQIDRFRHGSDDVGLVYTGRKVVDDGEVSRIRLPAEPPADITKALLCRNVVGTQSSVVVRADVAKRTPFDEQIPRWADLEWYVAVSTECEFAVLREPLVIYDRSADNRISDDYEMLEESYRLFVDKYRDLAAEYGPLFERKMLAWAAFRVGNASLNARHYGVARRYFLRAVARYPFESKFHVYAATTLGGRTTHRISRLVKRVLPRGIGPTT
jgi:glycosyltransferase involved in cell wall biosynthesis